MGGISSHVKFTRNIPKLTKLVPVHSILSILFMNIGEWAVIVGSGWTTRGESIKLSVIGSFIIFMSNVLNCCATFKTI